MSARDQLETDHFRTVVSKDLSRLVLGDLIGSGCFREVYHWRPDRKLVAKIENGAGNFANIIEHAVWDRIKHTDFARWFAPVEEISDCGSVLLQARTEPVSRCELPDRVPAFFTDLKPANWGRIGRDVVCHDYGLNLLMEVGMTKRMRKADWS